MIPDPVRLRCTQVMTLLAGGECHQNSPLVELWRYWRVCKSCQGSLVSASVAYFQPVEKLFDVTPSGFNHDVEVVSTFYVASLWDLVGEGYHSPSLSSLATAWVSYPGVYLALPACLKPHSISVDEFREPAKTLFSAGLARCTDQEIAGSAESWQHKREWFGPPVEQRLTKGQVPCLQPDADKPSLTSVVATFICGSIAVEKYSLLSPRFVPVHQRRREY